MSVNEGNADQVCNFVKGTHKSFFLNSFVKSM